MAIETLSGRTFIYDGLAQTDVDMANHRLINLDTSNLPPIGIPPTINPPPNQWLHDWDSTTHTWTATQPNFSHIAGSLTRTQQAGITELGTIRIGVWAASAITPAFLPALNHIRAPDGNLNLNQKRIANLSDPVDPQDAVNLNFLESVYPGLKPKPAVRVATTSVISRTNGLYVIDGVQLVDNDRVLVKNQIVASRGYQNGIWVAHSGDWTRPADFDSVPDDSELVFATTYVLEGTMNAGTTWVQMTLSPLYLVINVSLRYPSFQIFASNASAVIIAGLGMSRTGNTLNVGGTTGRILVGTDTVDIDPGYTGQTSITTLGSVTAGTWNGNTITGARGGTGVSNSGRLITVCGNVSTLLASGFPSAPDAVEGRNLSFNLIDHTLLTLPKSGTIVTETAPQNLSNKRIQKRVESLMTASKPVLNTDQFDAYKLTSQDVPILSFSENLTGTPYDAQDLYIFIEEVHELPPPPAPQVPIVQNFPITWGAAFRDSPGVQLPGTTVGLGGLFLWFVFNAVHGKWVLAQKIEDIAL